MQDVVIASAVRTAIGRFTGSLKDIRAPELGARAIKAAFERAGIGPADVEEVLMGQVITAGMGQNPARQASIYAGIPHAAGAFTINKVCGSGLKAAMLAASSIKAGDIEIAVAGGMENMTQAPYLLREARLGFRLNDGKVVDSMVNDGLWDIYNNFHMGNTGELIAEKFHVSREDADRFAARSHQLAAKASANGGFDAEIVPVEIPQRKGDPIIFKIDEGVRADSSAEKLARLKPVFKKDGLVTAGNASQISDGASATVVMSSKAAEEKGAKPLARIVGYGTGGLAPEWVMEAPIPAVEKLLARTGMKADDIGLWEHNEAFASASCAVQKHFNIPDERFNVNGGAVALGHPIGASGARCLTTLVHAMRDRQVDTGLVTLCLGGGNAVAMIVERI